MENAVLVVQSWCRRKRVTPLLLAELEVEQLSLVRDLVVAAG